MSVKHTYVCDGCKKEGSSADRDAPLFAYPLQLGGFTFHICNAECAKDAVTKIVQAFRATEKLGGTPTVVE